MLVSLLTIFYLLDSHWYRREGVMPVDPTPDTTKRFGAEGSINFVLLGAVVVLVLISGTWKPGIEFNIAGTPVALSQTMHAAAPGSEMVIIPEASHLSNVEQPEAFEKALTGFLARH